MIYIYIYGPIVCLFFVMKNAHIFVISFSQACILFALCLTSLVYIYHAGYNLTITCSAHAAKRANNNNNNEGRKETTSSSSRRGSLDNSPPPPPPAAAAAAEVEYNTDEEENDALEEYSDGEFMNQEKEKKKKKQDQNKKHEQQQQAMFTPLRAPSQSRSYDGFLVSTHPDIEEVVMRHVNSAQLLQCVAKELSFRIPKNCVHEFPDMLDELDQSKDRLGVSSYGVSVTTLEEV
jgi:hypothetical protein